MSFPGRSALLGRWGEEILAGVAGGLLMALSFPPYPTRILSLVALVPLFRYFLRGRPADAAGRGTLRRGFVAGWIFGIVFFLILLFWITNLIPASSVHLRWVLTPGLLLLVMYLGLFTGLFTLSLAALHRRRGVPALFLAPAIWAVTEQMRSSGELAFSWGIISSSLAPYPVAIQGLAAAGPFGLGMPIVLINLLLALVLFGRGRARRLGALVSLAAVVAAALAGGAARIDRIDARLASRDLPADVAVVQPNVDLAKKWKAFYRDSVFVEIEQYAGRAAALGARLVIFPETAAPISMSHHLVYRDWMKRIARGAGTDVYIGYVRHEKDGERWISYNSSGLFDSTGLLVAQYDKVNLLQFGERIPFSQYIGALERMEFGQANFRPGEEQTLFESPAGRFGSLICFESTFSDFTRRYVRGGADFLVNITNDGWFGSARGPLQHSESAIMRAVENGVNLLRAANTGVSMYIDPAGRVIDRIGLDDEGMLLVPVHKPRGLTLYCRFGRLVLLALVLANAAAVAPLLLRRADGPGGHVNYGRKAWHLAGGAVVVAMLVLFAPSRLPALGTLAVTVAALAAIDIWRWRSSTGDRLFWRYLGPLAGEKERRGPTTSLYYAAALLLCVLVFPRYAAIGAVISLAAGDPVAAIVGRRWGRIRIAGKSVEGAAANALVSFALIRVFVPWSAVAAAGALAGALIEIAPIPRLDDNLTVPLAAGCAMLAAAALAAG